MIEFVVPGTPIPLQRARIRGGQGGYLPRDSRSRDYRDRIQKAWMAAGRPVLEGPITFGARFYRADRRRLDLDNLLKAVLDALTGCVWADDSQVLRFSEVSLRRDPEERTEVRVWRAMEKAA
jgi:Holliday junction resolvase RusA-like endonuclease